MDRNDTIDNKTLCEYFKCSPQGGMRKSNSSNSLVLISNHAKSVYDDRWIGNEFHYTGMGLEGDQDLFFSQNKTLHESNSNKVELHLFEVFKDKEYTYFGEVILSNKPYQEIQTDVNGNLRKVWMFPLRLKEGEIPIISQEQFENLENLKKNKVKKLNHIELEKRARSASKEPGSRTTIIKAYERNESVAEFVKLNADGICQLCEKPAPFENKNSEPYLESHHINWLSRGGEDTIENTVALCPNCHRKMHILDSKYDVDFLLNKANNACLRSACRARKT